MPMKMLMEEIIAILMSNVWKMDELFVILIRSAWGLLGIQRVIGRNSLLRNANHRNGTGNMNMTVGNNGI